MSPKSKKPMLDLWRLCVVRTKVTKPLDPIPRLIVSAQAREAIEREACSSPDRETGGILVGYVEPPITLRVTAASGPGPNAQRTPTYFLRDRTFCSAFLHEHFERDGANYIGDWHSHLKHIASRELSGTDLLTLIQTISDPDYADLPAFGKILAVFSSSPLGSRRTKTICQHKENSEQFESNGKIKLRGFLALREFVAEVQIEDGSRIEL